MSRILRIPVHRPAILALILLAALVLGPMVGAPARAGERRVALVIGNGRYEAVARLPNPAADAEAVAATLREAGFESVTLAQDLTRERLIDALRRFSGEAARADWAVLYYAGHGIEMGGTNYLIPIDARLASDRDLQFEGVPMVQAMLAVEGARRFRLLILDACRDNPFAAMARSFGATRSIGRGLARVEPLAGTLVAFAAKDGQVAEDGDGGHSPYVTALVRHLRTPGLEVARLFRRVTGDVLAATNRRQEPFTYGSLPDEDFYFHAPPPALPAPPAPSPIQAAVVEPPAVRPATTDVLPVVRPLPAPGATPASTPVPGEPATVKAPATQAKLPDTGSKPPTALKPAATVSPVPRRPVRRPPPPRRAMANIEPHPAPPRAVPPTRPRAAARPEPVRARRIVQRVERPAPRPRQTSPAPGARCQMFNGVPVCN